MIIIAIAVLCGMISGSIAGWWDDGPTMAIAFALIGAILGGIVGVCIALLAGAAI